MTTGSIIALDLALAVLIAAGWLGAGAAAAAGRRRITLVIGLTALAATLARAVTIILLARAGWWFAAEKVVFAAPMALAGMLAAGSRLLRPAAGLRPASLALLFAGYAQTSALLITLFAGYPLSGGVAVTAVGAVVAATAITWRFLGTSRFRTGPRAAAVVTLAVVTAVIGLTGTGGAAPAVQNSHQHRSAPSVGEATERWTLTAGTAVVEAGGREVEAWAFNGQVPGPQLTATVGDVIEVTLRNRDIDRGVTLHWHGYDVPNDQDGVPGVTQDAVLPGAEFVYKFRAEQAGSYWYHTHAVSGVGVRMGLYGVLVVNPAAGVDHAIPVHTLGGQMLPEPTMTTISERTPVRLRLINTDSVTHRYALAGTRYRVVAIDGVDLVGPAPLTDTAVLIPAGGRYDLAFDAPAAPVGLFVDQRLLWSTGPMETEPTATGTSGWPVLDPLTYGDNAPAPWSRADREFTLVLDRGLDLHGLLPRYAHTVNGAADPGIPSQTVRSGEVVELTIVNRSLVVHPWHLHGHHVLVLARDGTPVSGSPLWLDSFDVRPGEVWKVAFRADNPGMWANHCHNLPHADQGMTLHLMYA